MELLSLPLSLHPSFFHPPLILTLPSNRFYPPPPPPETHFSSGQNLLPLCASSLTPSFPSGDFKSVKTWRPESCQLFFFLNTSCCSSESTVTKKLGVFAATARLNRLVGASWWRLWLCRGPGSLSNGKNEEKKNCMKRKEAASQLSARRLWAPHHIAAVLQSRRSNPNPAVCFFISDINFNLVLLVTLRFHTMAEWRF